MPASPSIGTLAEPAERWTALLLDAGYCIIPDAIESSVVDAVSIDMNPAFDGAARSIGPFYGDATKRVHSLLRRSPHMTSFVLHPVVLAIVQSILGPNCDLIQLNLTQAIEILPGGEAQPPHRDQDMWPVRTPAVEYLVNVMWPYTPYTAANGATKIWPGSHRRQDEIVIADDEAIVAEMVPGSALLFLGSTLHAGGANATDVSRRGMIVSYSLGWLKPYELPWLAYPPAIARDFVPELADLAGYRAHRPNLGTFEGRCPSTLLGEEAPDRLGAIDSLRPEHEELIEAYRKGLITPDGAYALSAAAVPTRNSADGLA